MTNGPDGIRYGRDDRLPLAELVVNAVQHIAIIAPVGLVFPSLVAGAAGLSSEGIQAVVAASLIALGIGSIILCHGGRWFGSGFLAPSIFTAAYLPACLAAAQTGGMPLVAGMTIFAGLCEIGWSFVLHRWRSLLPVEISGLSVVMIGLMLGLLGFQLIFELEPSEPFRPGLEHLDVAVLGIGSLALIMALNVWGRGPVRTFAVLIGVTAGYVAAALGGLVDGGTLSSEGASSLVQLPSLPLVLPTFDASLAPQFLVGALAAAMRAMGDITTCQRLYDRRWVRPDFGSIERGVRGDGLSTIISGLLGSVGLNSFSGSIGLSQASGVLARQVGYAVGAVFFILAFFPPVIAIAAAIPRPVTGAVLLFSSTFILANGLQIIVARMLDARRILTLGLGFFIGTSHAAFLAFYTTLPSWIGTIASSALVLSLVTALGLNAIFRIGITRTVRGVFPVDRELPTQAYELCEAGGAATGARRDVVDRVATALVEAAELALGRSGGAGTFDVSATFDEYYVEVSASFPSGTGAAVGDAEDELEAALANLPMLLIQRQADRVVETTAAGRTTLRLRFDA
ncbi:hypothetical protein STAQ_16690 [Allostella sp. ATCC 35155]|nr:hypothetical protein STAQ_16690 [Stella sp. ATCC 35155]